MNLNNQIKFALKTAACCVLTFGMGLPCARGASVLLDFGPTSVASPYLTLDPGHDAGTISGSDTTWNVISSSATTSSLFFGDGSAAAGLTLTMGQEATAGNNAISFSTAITKITLAGTGGAVAGQQSLLGTGSIYGNGTSSTAVGRDGFFGDGSGATGNAIGLRLDGLTAGDYLIYVMARNVNSDAASIPMSIYSSVGASAGTFDFSSLSGLTEANTGFPSATYSGEYNSFQAGENFVGLNVSLGAGDSLFLAVDGGSAGETRGFLNSVQIVAVPEPGAIALAGLGFAGLLIFRRRA